MIYQLFKVALDNTWIYSHPQKIEHLETWELFDKNQRTILKIPFYLSIFLGCRNQTWQWNMDH